MGGEGVLAEMSGHLWVAAWWRNRAANCWSLCGRGFLMEVFPEEELQGSENWGCVRGPGGEEP